MMMCLVCQSHQLLEHSGCQVDESGVVFFSCICVTAPAFACSHFFFSVLQFVSTLCARVRVCLAGIIGGRLPLALFRAGLDEMRGPSVRHQGRPSEIVRPTCNSAEISP